MIQVVLTNSFKTALIDDHNAALVLQYSWYLKRASFNWYVATSVRQGNKVKTILLHRLIMPTDKKHDIHHKNGNPLNNLENNLEIISHRSCHRKEKVYV